MAKKFGLGRGLAELQQEISVTPNISAFTERVVVRQIPLNQIGANPNQPRKNFTDAELRDLAASIKENGVLQPILVRTIQNKPYNYEIVAGERRWRASKLAGKTEIPALIKTLNDTSTMEIALIENVQRQDLNPIEEGAAYQNLMQTCGYTISDVSHLIGKSESYIRNILRLDTLPTPVKELIEQGKLSASHARTIAVADDPTKLANDILKNNLSVADTAKLVKKNTRKPRVRAYTSKTLDLSEIKKIESDIKAKFGVATKIQEKRGGAGQVILGFDNRVQLYELVKKLTK